MTGNVDVHKFDRILDDVEDAFTHATTKHTRPHASLHESYAILMEEVEEFWDELKLQNPDPANLRKELLQIAAVAIRAIHDSSL